MLYKLLLVDDESEIRNGLSQYFPWDEVGFEIVGLCENGKQALEFVDAHEVDVILCDIRMPIMDGIEVAKRIHEQKKEIKIIFLSGFKDFDYARQALMYGVKDYIVKPTRFKELQQVFSSLKLELDELRGDRDRSDEEQRTFDQKVILEIKRYVEENYRHATLDEAASRVHMNPFYVSKYFKNKTGQTFSDYVVSVKMEKAAELLMDIRYKTYEVSEMVGYTSPKNFTRTFKRYFGKSPREFRQSGAQGEQS